MSRSFLRHADKGNELFTGRFSPIETPVVSGENGWSVTRVAHGAWDIDFDDESVYSEVVDAQADVMIPYNVNSGMQYEAAFCTNANDYNGKGLKSLRLVVINSANGQLADVADAEVTWSAVLRRKNSNP